MTGLQGEISDISHNETILLGLAVKQSEHIREIRLSIAAVNERLDSLEITVNKRLDSLETRFNSLETTVNEHTTRFDRLETMLAQVLARLPEKP